MATEATSSFQEIAIGTDSALITIEGNESDFYVYNRDTAVATGWTISGGYVVFSATTTEVLLLRRIVPIAPYSNFIRGNRFGEDIMNGSFQRVFWLMSELYDGFRPDASYEKQDLIMGGFKIIGLADPTEDQEAATKAYVDQWITDAEYWSEISRGYADGTGTEPVVNSSKKYSEDSSNSADASASSASASASSASSSSSSATSSGNSATDSETSNTESAASAAEAAASAASVDGAEIAANTAARHNESHNIESHSDTDATGTELNTLTDGSIAGALHDHARVVFPATAVPSSDPNTLDDYEEGTFTMYIYDASTGGNQGGSGSGTYTKIGNLVNIGIGFGNINISGLTGGNDAYFREFPFSVDGESIGALKMDSVTFTGDYLVFAASGLYGRVVNCGSGIADSALDVSAFADDVADISTNLSYFI